MLKKLLASVLAVATVASCASVASAATTYETADPVDYAIWALNNPAATEEEVTVTVYIASNVGTATVPVTVKKSQNNAETVKEAFVKEIKEEVDFSVVDGLGKYELVAFTQSASNIYLAQIVYSEAVVYSEYDPDATAVADTKADTLAAADMKLLGYYTYPVDASAVLADMYAKVPNAKLADQEFAYWAFNNNVVAPVYKNEWNHSVYYTDAKIVLAVDGANAAELVAGTYALKENAWTEFDSVKLTNNDKANWNTYLTNYAKLEGLDETVVLTKDGKEYKFAGFRLVAANKYAAIYAPVADPATNEFVKYTLVVRDKATDEVVFQEDADVKFAANASVYTTDLDAVYAYVKKDGMKATLAEQLVVGKDAHTTIWTLGEVYYAKADERADSVTVGVYAVPAEEYTVYSFAPANKVVKSTVYLTADQIDVTEYKNVDGTSQIVTSKEVIKATAADLGVAATATIDGVPAVYAYAQYVAEYAAICTTYKMGDATVELADFATTTGKFNAEAYFCREAKAGDEVTLKVSLSAAGEAKKLDVAKIAVEFDVIGATAGETYAFAATELYKAGTAAQITLAEGTNIVTATVYYNGVKVGTFAPFYAAV